jgi:hypothetical protein
MSLGTVLALLQVLLSDVTPTLKAAALAELKTLEVEEASKPTLLFLIKLVESALAAAAVPAA